jgi:hypothetical protein
VRHRPLKVLLCGPPGMAPEGLAPALPPPTLRRQPAAEPHPGCVAAVSDRAWAGLVALQQPFRPFRRASGGARDPSGDRPAAAERSFAAFVWRSARACRRRAAPAAGEAVRSTDGPAAWTRCATSCDRKAVCAALRSPDGSSNRGRAGPPAGSAAGRSSFGAGPRCRPLAFGEIGEWGPTAQDFPAVGGQAVFGRARRAALGGRLRPCHHPSVVWKPVVRRSTTRGFTASRSPFVVSPRSATATRTRSAEPHPWTGRRRSLRRAPAAIE